MDLASIEFLYNDFSLRAQGISLRPASDKKSEQDTKVELFRAIDKITTDQMKACTRSQTPLCLDGAMKKMFGQSYQDLLLSIAERSGYDRRDISSPRDVWTKYFDLMESWAKGMGKDVAHVLEFQTLQEMEKMPCGSCPLYEMEKQRLHKKSDELKEH